MLCECDFPSLPVLTNDINEPLEYTYYGLRAQSRFNSLDTTEFARVIGECVDVSLCLQTVLRHPFSYPLKYGRTPDGSRKSWKPWQKQGFCFWRVLVE